LGCQTSETCPRNWTGLFLSWSQDKQTERGKAGIEPVTGKDVTNMWAWILVIMWLLEDFGKWLKKYK
jgi:hypothetical protein